MKAFKNPATWLAILALQGCTSATAPSPAVKETPIASLDVPESIQPQTFIIRGQAVIGHETRSFTPCGSKNQYWLDISPDQMQQALELVSRPYQPMYAELIGYLAAPSQTGYNADFAAQFIVTQINQLSVENPNRCDQALKSTTAFGNEPFWSATFKKDQLELSNLGKEKQNLSIKSSRVSQKKRDYQLDSGHLQLTQATCNDGMSDSIYGWKAVLSQDDMTTANQSDNKKYKGCATLANQDPTLEWAGLYFATSTKNVGFSIELQLLPDHSAITTYRYENKDRPTVEKGFWQQLNKDQIQVVMTHHQQQYLVFERIFNRDGYQLVAEKEKVGEVVYPIANGGLTLYRAMPEPVKTQSTPLTNVDLTAQQVPSSDQYNQQVDDAIRHYFKIHKTSPDNTQYRWLTYDLNGDGKDELLAQLDWCGTGGCTLLIFEHHEQQWRFNSRITQVKGHITLGKDQQHGWQDLLLNTSGGGLAPAQHKLSYSGVSYPLNPTVSPFANPVDNSAVTLFSDELSPRQNGVKM